MAHVGRSGAAQPESYHPQEGCAHWQSPGSAWARGPNWHRDTEARRLFIRHTHQCQLCADTGPAPAEALLEKQRWGTLESCRLSILDTNSQRHLASPAILPARRAGISHPPALHTCRGRRRPLQAPPCKVMGTLARGEAPIAQCSQQTLCLESVHSRAPMAEQARGDTPSALSQEDTAWGAEVTVRGQTHSRPR